MLRTLLLLAFACAASAQVTVTPDLSSNPVPANLLRFYLHFPQPMARGLVLQNLHLYREGAEVSLPFLDLELWDREQKRLTVLVDPGRIKRGVAPQQEAGEVLEVGHAYALVLESKTPDADGRPLNAEFRREFRVGLALRQGIDPNQWRLDASAALVRVDFDRTMDVAIVERGLDVYDSSGQWVDGEAHVEDARWVFTPAKPLPPGRYELRIDPTLEDIAGNRLGRPFDVDVAMRPASGVTTTLRFEIPAQPRP